jgi:exonuclease SbcC
LKLISLQLKNFRQYADVRVVFESGVTAIVGPNGAGKTTLLEAIAWSLYGSPALRGNNDALKRSNAPARSPVEATLDFALGAHRYRIFRRPDRVELYVDGSPSPVHVGAQPVAEAVRKLLGMDYRAFFTSYFTGQKEIAFLAGMGKQERAVSVSRMLGYERLSRARDKSNQDRLALDKEIQLLQQGMGDPVGIVQAREAAEADLKAAQRDAEAAKKRHEKAKKSLESLRPKYELQTERKARYDELQKQFQITETGRDHAQSRIESVRKEIDRLDRLSEELKAIQPDLDAYREAEREFDEMRPLLKHEKERRSLMGRLNVLQDQIARLRPQSEGMEAARSVQTALQDRRERAEAALSQAQDELAKLREEWASKRAELTAERKSLEAGAKTLAERKARLSALGESGVCPTCSRPLGEDLPQAISHYDREIAEIVASQQRVQTQWMAMGREAPGESNLASILAARQAEIKQLRAQETDAQKKVQEIQMADRSLREQAKSLAETQNQLAKLPSGFDNARYEELADIARRLKETNKRGVEIESEIKRRPEWSFRLQEAETEWSLLAERLDEIQKSMASVRFSPDDYEKLTADFNAADREERESERSVHAAAAEFARAEGSLRVAQDREAEYERKAGNLRELQSRRLHLRTLTESLESLRVELNARVRPELEEVASDFLKDLTDGRYQRLDLTEQYEPFIVEDGERKPVISGGEEDVTHLCLRLAISRMIAERSGQPLSLLVLDEIFGSLDASRRDNVVVLLQRLKSIFEQIILITHIEAIHDVVDQCLWVSLDPQTRTSAISEAPSDSTEIDLSGLDVPDPDLSEAA